MKKKSLLFSCLLLAVGMLLVFCGCSNYGNVKSAFEKNGYEEVQASDEVKALYENSEDYKKISEVVKLHIMQKKGEGLLSQLNVAIIAEFNTNKDMEEALKAHVTQQDAENIYEELQKLDTVSGNCFLLFYTPLTDGGKIFKETK